MNIVQKFTLAFFLLFTIGLVVVPVKSVQAACQPTVIGIGGQPLTVSKAKPTMTVKLLVGNLTGCDANSSKNIKVYAKAVEPNVKLTEVILSNYASKFAEKKDYSIDVPVNILNIAGVKNYKSFPAIAGMIVGDKDTPNNTTTIDITNSSGTKDGKPSTPKTPANQNASTEEKIDESGQSGFVICGNTVDTPCNITHLFRGMIIIINYLITMAGFIAVLFILIAGVQMTMSQGQEWHKRAIQKLSGAVIGLVLVAVTFVLINSLLSGSLSLGIKDGTNILTNPKKYINQE